MRNSLFTIFIILMGLVMSPFVLAAQVTYVIDGDTVILNNRERVRLIGVDAPEIASKYHREEYYGEKAKEYLTHRLEGQEITLKSGPEAFDKYGRRLGFIYLEDGSFVNEDLIREGYAEAYRKFPFKYRDQFILVEEEAREQRRGLWGKRKRPWWIAVWPGL